MSPTNPSVPNVSMSWIQCTITRSLHLPSTSTAPIELSSSNKTTLSSTPNPVEHYSASSHWKKPNSLKRDKSLISALSQHKDFSVPRSSKGVDILAFESLKCTVSSPIPANWLLLIVFSVNSKLVVIVYYCTS